MTLVLPSFATSSPATFWYRARLTKSQMSRAASSTFLPARALVGAAIRASRAPNAHFRMGADHSFVLAPYGKHWRSMRNMAYQAMNRTAAKRYWPGQEKDIHLFLQSLLDHPTSYRTALRFLGAKTIMTAAYGIDVDSPQNQYVTLAEEAHVILARAMVPGSFLVDTIPILKYVPSWVPGAGFQKLAAKGKHALSMMIDQPFEFVKQAVSAGEAKPDFVSTLLEEKDAADKDSADEYNYRVKWAAGSLYGAGTESVFACLSTFFLAMAMYPDVQKKAQNELDKVVGTDRLPSWNDREHLPYINAVLMETLRWHPPTPIAIAHRLTEDDVYKGFYIPREALIMPNTWAISQDPNNYKDPQRFCPERFLDPDTPELDPYLYVFGIGRRNCIGMHFATATFYMTMASFLSTFNIAAEGKVEAKFSPQFVSYAEDFPCTITPRSKEAAELVSSATA